MEISEVEAFSSLVPTDCTFISYQLYFEVERPVTVKVGKLGKIRFNAGSYVYTGSAKRNIHARVIRHLSNNKKLHWHIDYLLAAKASKISEVVLSEETECDLNAMTPGSTPVPGFGSSDCRSKCGSHLKFVHGPKSTNRQTQANVKTVRRS